MGVQQSVLQQALHAVPVPAEVCKPLGELLGQASLCTRSYPVLALLKHWTGQLASFSSLSFYLSTEAFLTVYTHAAISHLSTSLL